jgi:hypothetical protein
MYEVVGEGFCQKVGFPQKPWQALFVKNPIFITFTPVILGVLGNIALF